MIWAWHFTGTGGTWHSVWVVAPSLEEATVLFRALRCTWELVQVQRGEPVLGVKLSAEQEAALEVERLVR